MKIMKILAIFTVLFTINLQAEDQFWDKIKENGSTTWEKTKKIVKDTDKEDIKEAATDTYDTTKEFVEEKTKPTTAEMIWNKTKNISSNIWKTTKEYSGKALDKTKEVYENLNKD